MLYPYITLADETEICHTQVLNDNCVEVHFERPNETGFKTARCVLPDYKWKTIEGFAPEEIAFFEQFLASNAHLIYEYARSGGIHCA